MFNGAIGKEQMGWLDWCTSGCNKVKTEGSCQLLSAFRSQQIALRAVLKRLPGSDVFGFTDAYGNRLTFSDSDPMKGIGGSLSGYAALVDSNGKSVPRIVYGVAICNIINIAQFAKS